MTSLPSDPTLELLRVLGPALTGLALALLAAGMGPVWDALGSRRVARLAAEMPALELDTSFLKPFLRGWGIALIMTTVVLVFAGMPVVLPLALFVLYMVPGWVLRSRIERRKTLLRDQMVSASISLANATRAGQSLAQGLESVAAEQPEPIAIYLRRLVRDYQLGRTLTDSIADVKERINLDSFTTFAVALTTTLERGGKLTDALESISKSLIETQRLERKLEADTASGRQLLKVLGAFPVVFLLGFYVMDPKSTGLMFSTYAGQAVLDAVGVLIYVAVIWANRILAIDI